MAVNYAHYLKIKMDSDYLKASYVTKDLYHWICQDCFDDFKDQFNWRVEEYKIRTI